MKAFGKDIKNFFMFRNRENEDDQYLIKNIHNGDRYRHKGRHTVLHDDEIFSDFKEGHYIIKLTVYWLNNIKRKLSISAYSDHSLKLDQVKDS